MMLVQSAPVRRVTAPALVVPTYDGPAELPRITIDTTYDAPTGGTDHVCTTAAEFTTALADSVRGDTITLTAGNTFTGSFVLPAKSGTGWIYIRSSALASLPAGTRVDSGDTANMPTIVGAGSPVRAFTTSGAASHWRLAGLEIKCPTDNFCTTLIQIGAGETTLASLPNNITFDRCYVHGDATIGGRRGIGMNGATIAVVDCNVSDFKEDAADSQALAAWNSPGPIKIQNNYLEAAGENVMFGGADPTITNLIVSDIEVRANHFYKPTAWIGSAWDVKNLFEIKNAQRVLVERNQFENIWLAEQTGYCFNLKAVNQDGGASWCACADVTIRYNRLVNCGNGISITGVSDQPATVGARFSIRHNLIGITNVNSSDGYGVAILGGPEDVQIKHNTILHISAGANPHAVLFDDGSSGAGRDAASLVLLDNIQTRGTYGIKGQGQIEGNTTLEAYAPGYSITNTAFIGASSGAYPADNFFPADVAAISFTNFAGGDYTLSGSSDYRAGAANDASDGTDLGADVATVETYAAAAVAG